MCLVAGHASAQTKETCTPWPGEIDPLPTISDPDPFAARWARLRATELARLAVALEPENPAEAYRLWTHTECLVPESSAAARAAELAPGFVVTRRPPSPKLASREPAREPAPPRPTAAAPAVRPAPPAPPAASVSAARRPAQTRDFVRFDAQLAAAEESLRRARFREVVQATAVLRSELERADAREGGVRERRVRIEVLDASALVALGKPDGAAQSFARALDADPELVLDPVTTSPKIRAILEEVRQAKRAQGR